MVRLETYSRNGGKAILEEKDIIDEVHEIPTIWATHAGQYNHAERSNALDE